MADVDASADDGGDASATAPISAPNDAWTWVDFPDSKCASGSATGIAVNPHASATTLLIYMEGGGSCHDATTCWGAKPTANNVAGYDATTFAATKTINYPLLDRTLAGNPMAQMSMAFIPYCTGDLHAGTKEVDLNVDGSLKPTYFWGATDMDMFLARLVPTFTGVKRVVLLGTSAGGFGTFMNFDHVAHAFGVRVDIVDDSGPAIPPNSDAGAPTTGLGPWGVVPPSGCTSCTSLRNILDFDRTEQPASAYAFMSFAEDPTIAPDFGYDPITDYPTVMTNYTASFASDPHAHTFIVTNEEQHVVETDPTLAAQYAPWVTLMLNDDPSWANQVYAHP